MAPRKGPHVFVMGELWVMLEQRPRGRRWDATTAASTPKRWPPQDRLVVRPGQGLQDDGPVIEPVIETVNGKTLIQAMGERIVLLGGGG